MEESKPRSDLKRKFAEALEAIVPNIEAYQPIKEVSHTDDLILAIRDPHVPFTIVKMTEVTLNACPAGRFKTFCEALKFNRTLRTVTVTIDDSECQALIDALNVNRNVTRVNMTVRYLDVDVEKMLTSDTCQKLSDMMTRNRALKKLQITVRGNCAVIFTILGKSFVRPQNTLVTLVVEDKMGKKEFENLIETLRQSRITALKIGYYFSLAQNAQASPAQCSAEGTQILCNYIRQSQCTLEILKLRTPLTIEQTKQFAELMETNPRSLKTFYYEASKSYEAVDIITRAVTNNRTLRKYLIGCVRVLGKSYADLFQYLLHHNDTLESFAILNCPDTKVMWNDLAKALKDNKSLRVLYLLYWTGKKSRFIQDQTEGGRMSPSEGQSAVDNIKDNPSLTKVVLDTAIQIGSTTEINLHAILRRNRAKQNESYKNIIVTMYNIARTTTLPIDFWVHIFKHIQFYGINRDFGDILLNIFNNPSPRKVLN